MVVLHVTYWGRNGHVMLKTVMVVFQKSAIGRFRVITGCFCNRKVNFTWSGVRVEGKRFFPSPVEVYVTFWCVMLKICSVRFVRPKINPKWPKITLITPRGCGFAQIWIIKCFLVKGVSLLWSIGDSYAQFMIVMLKMSLWPYYKGSWTLIST